MDIRSDNVKIFIQKWLDNEGSFPALGGIAEYSFYVERCYPIEEDRRAYFSSICDKKEPSIGYHLTSLLHEIGLLQAIWTTNFDDLCSHAMIQNRQTVIDIALDTVDRIVRPLNREELLLIKLHGD